jgi:phytoene desaturase
VYLFYKNNKQMGKAVVIGGGFSGLAAASFVAQQGHKVTLLEKNSTVGGRARSFSAGGFMYDMGPSWYWMPDVFERFFRQFGRTAGDYYELTKLDPGFQMIFGANDVMPVPADLQELMGLFEKIEKGSAAKLKKFLDESEYKYRVAMNSLVYRPSYSWLEFARYDLLKGVAKLHVFQSLSKHVRGYFSDERLIALMEFPALFLGAMADRIPALYSLMNYSALVQGTWYPMGGMVKIAEGMRSLATELGVRFETDCNVTHIDVRGRKATGLQTSKGNITADGIIAAADYNHVEQKLLDAQYRNYDSEYWEKRTFAPSSLIYYVGVNRRIKKLIHHNLFFDTSLQQHAEEIYVNPSWPAAPLFYVCCPSKTDPDVAPEGMENLFILIPVAPGLKDTEEVRQKYFNTVMERMEALLGEPVKDHVVYQRSYCVSDFEQDYNAYKGNAYGLANTLRQTAVLKPTLKNRHIDNLFYAGQLTVPGPGVPPALISGEIAANELIKKIKSPLHEAIV